MKWKSNIRSNRMTNIQKVVWLLEDKVTSQMSVISSLKIVQPIWWTIPDHLVSLSLPNSNNMTCISQTHDFPTPPACMVWMEISSSLLKLSVTLKNKIVSTVLHIHHQNWDTLISNNNRDTNNNSSTQWTSTTSNKSCTRWTCHNLNNNKFHRLTCNPAHNSVDFRKLTSKVNQRKTLLISWLAVLNRCMARLNQHQVKLQLFNRSEWTWGKT